MQFWHKVYEEKILVINDQTEQNNFFNIHENIKNKINSTPNVKIQYRKQLIECMSVVNYRFWLKMFEWQRLN